MPSVLASHLVKRTATQPAFFGEQGKKPDLAKVGQLTEPRQNSREGKSRRCSGALSRASDEKVDQ